MPEGTSRRQLLAGAAAAAGGLLLAGCGGGSGGSVHPTVPTAPPSPADAARDVPILRAALALERQTVAAYTACIPLLDAARALWAKAFLSEELEHTGQLISLIRTAGAKAPDPADSYAIGHPRDGEQAIAVLAGLEQRQLDSYARWIPRLSAGTMRAGVASILANDAQHITALRAALGRPPLGSPWVVGAPGVVPA